jgi:iron complex transport system ATP-binding protein
MKRLIKFEQVHFRRDERNILTDVTFQMNPGEHWVILGKNGSGKSTILEMMNGYLFPSSGQITVLDNVYGTCDVREVRRQIGYTSQSLVEKLPLRDPVWEVVASAEFGFLRLYEEIDSSIRDKAVEMLHQVQLGHLWDQSWGILSQGERKKVLLARVLMTRPSIVIMDEPCAGLDLWQRENFLSNLDAFKQMNASMVYVTHHIEEIVPIFTHVALLDNGRIVASGEKRQVLTPEFMYQAFQVAVELEWVKDRPWIKVVE